jgi:hypothetical protein
MLRQSSAQVDHSLVEGQNSTPIKNVAANKVQHIRQINMRLGLFTPDLITPEQLYMEETV